MHDEVSKTIKLAVDVILASLLIFAIVAFAYYSHSAYKEELNNKSTQQLGQFDNKLYYYNNKEVSASDVIDCILSNARVYKFEVCGASNTSTLSTDQEGSLGVGFWSRDNIIHKIQNDLGLDWNSVLSNKFYAELIWTNSSYDVSGAEYTFSDKDQGSANITGYQVAGVRFTLEG